MVSQPQRTCRTEGLQRPRSFQVVVPLRRTSVAACPEYLVRPDLIATAAGSSCTFFRNHMDDLRATIVVLGYLDYVARRKEFQANVSTGEIGWDHGEIGCGFEGF